ncbi:MAG: NYN domain-containing protein [Phycisphaerae bacterium]
MPYLIDANNLMHALADVGYAVEREGLCELLIEALGKGAKVHVVFDGPEQNPAHTEFMLATGVDLTYAVGRPADAIIEELIAADTAPRRLNVVSTDRRIRAAARRRRCNPVRSEQFAREMRKRLTRPRRPAEPPEPQQKRKGLSPDETKRWLREFGLDDPD